MSKSKFLKTSVEASRLMFNLDRKAYIRNFAVGIVQTMSIVGSTVLMQFFFDALSDSVGQENGSKIILILILLAIVTVISEAINGYQNYLYGYYIDKGVNNITNSLHRKINSLPKKRMDDSNELSRIERARKGAANLVELILVLGDAVTFYGLYFIFLGIYFFNVDRKMIVILPLVFIPVMLAHLSKIKLFSKMDEENAIYSLQMDHFISCFTKINYIKEIKFLNAEGVFARKFFESLRTFQKNIYSTNARGAIKDIIGKLITFAGTVLIIALLTTEMIQGKITIGVFGAVLATLKQMFSLMDELISYHFGNAVENMGTVEAAMELLNEKEEPNIYNDYTDFSKIVFNNVCFTYPGQEKKALNNVSFEINKGEKIALVGVNGSGKSTLSKMIIGLYKPDSGSVIINQGEAGIHKDKRSAVFQEYMKYKISLEDNVRISAFDSTGNVQEALETYAKDIRVDLQTILGKEFGNQDLSGGQWQSLAIARGFYKDSGLMILDEPTAAIDPIKEDNYYTLFERALTDKTAIIVTHHLASVKIADRIMLLKDGEIKENGSFDELMALKGEFYRIYSAQADTFNDR